MKTSQFLREVEAATLGRVALRPPSAAVKTTTVFLCHIAGRACDASMDWDRHGRMEGIVHAHGILTDGRWHHDLHDQSQELRVLARLLFLHFAIRHYESIGD